MVGLQLLSYVVRFSEQAVHAGVVAVGQKIGCVPVYPIYPAHVLLHIHLCGEWRQAVLLVACLIRIHGV